LFLESEIVEDIGTLRVDGLNEGRMIIGKDIVEGRKEFFDIWKYLDEERG
jgi:hypothetical protein